MREDALVWDEIRDFRPGIVQRSVGDQSGTSQPAAAGSAIPPYFGLGPKGSAAQLGTFGCYALPQGPLCPLPGQDYTFNIAFNPGYTCPIVFQTGLVVMPQTPSGGPFLPDVGVIPTNPQVGIYAGYIFANPGSSLMQHKVYRWSLFRGNNSTGALVTNFIIQHNTQPNITSSSGMYMAPFEAIVGVATAPTRDVAFYSEDATGAAVIQYSDSATLGATVNGQLLMMHQQRLVSLVNLAGQLVVTSPGGNTDAWMLLNEAIQFTLPGLYGPAGPEYLGTEIPYGYGVMASQSASDLLMVKHSGGGLLVQGDLAAPIVRRLPEVASTYGSTCYGAATPVGYVYGQNHGGVYAWSGGDTSQLLSGQLQDGFWLPPTWVNSGTGYDITPYRGKFCFWKDWVLTPNGWLYDTLTGGWWQLQQSSPASCSEWAVDPYTNRLFGSVPSSTVTNNTLVPMILGWNPAQPAHSYQWTSNPVWMVQNQPWAEGELRWIILEIQGTGPSSFLGVGPALTISFQTEQTGGGTGAGGFVNQVSVTPPSSFDVPTRVRVPVPQSPTPVQGTFISFQIQVGGGSGPAPIINAIGWGAKPIRHTKAA